MLFNPPISQEEDVALGRPSVDTSERHALDRIIRKRGYTVMSRPKSGETVWERNGVPFKQSDVMMREGLV